MKRYYDLTTEEKLSLCDNDLYQAVKLEGIHRGIKPPITIDSALSQGCYVGFSIPADSVTFYEVVAPGQYSTDHPTGLAFKTAEEARRAMIGAVRIEQESYGAKKINIFTGAFSVREVYVGFAAPKQYSTTLEEFSQDDADFNALCEECRVDCSKLHQEKYNREVNLRKRAEYLSLAGGNEEIAKAFWDKTEKTEFPAE